MVESTNNQMQDGEFEDIIDGKSKSIIKQLYLLFIYHV